MVGVEKKYSLPMCKALFKMLDCWVEQNNCTCRKIKRRLKDTMCALCYLAMNLHSPAPSPYPTLLFQVFVS